MSDSKDAKTEAAEAENATSGTNPEASGCKSENPPSPDKVTGSPMPQEQGSENIKELQSAETTSDSKDNASAPTCADVSAKIENSAANPATISSEAEPSVVTSGPTTDKDEDNNKDSINNSLHCLSDLAAKQLETLATPSAPAPESQTSSSDAKDKEKDNGNKPDDGAAEKANPQNPPKRSTKPKKSKAHLRKGKWTVSTLLAPSLVQLIT